MKIRNSASGASDFARIGLTVFISILATALIALSIAGCAGSQDPNQPPPNSPPGTPTVCATTTLEGQMAINENIAKIAAVKAGANQAGRPLTFEEAAYIDALEKDNRDIRAGIQDLAAAPADPPDPADPTLIALTTLFGLVPPPFGAMLAGFVPPAFFAYRNWGGRKALTALVKAIKKTKERDPAFAESLSENKTLINLTVGPSKTLIDKVRSEVGDDPNAPPVVIPITAPREITT